MVSGGQNSDGEEEATLRLLPSSIAERIRWTKDEDALRRFACACAEEALRMCGSGDSQLYKTISLARESGGIALSQLDDVKLEVERIVARLDEAAFEAQEAAGHGTRSREEYVVAFRAARAATSVLRVFVKPAARAAAEACYEALHALDGDANEGTLLGIALRELGS